MWYVYEFMLFFQLFKVYTLQVDGRFLKYIPYFMNIIISILCFTF